MDFQRGTFRVRGDVVEVLPVYERNEAVRIEFFGDQIDRILAFDPSDWQGNPRAGPDRYLSRQSLRDAQGTFKKSHGRHSRRTAWNASPGSKARTC